MKTTEFVNQNEQLVLEHYGLSFTNNNHIDCPICQSKKSFRINRYNGRASYICKCGSGGIIKLLQEVRGCDFKTIANEIDKTFNIERTKDYTPTTNTTLNDCVSKFLTLRKPACTQVQEYLNNRGITIMPRSGVRYSQNNFDQEYNCNFAAMYAIASNEYNEAVYRHLTYLKDGNKANIKNNKKMLKLSDQSGSVSVKMFPHQDVLGIAEGIETALSAQTISKVPTWAALNSSLLKRFKAPIGVKKLYIFADNDKNGTGLAAAFECGNKNILSKNDVKNVVIRWPSDVCDYNDFLLVGGGEHEVILSE